MDSRPEQMTQDHAVSTWRVAIQGLWIAVRLLAVFYMGQAGARFFYQGF
jgi:hypothetical protein